MSFFDYHLVSSWTYLRISVIGQGEKWNAKLHTFIVYHDVCDVKYSFEMCPGNSLQFGDCEPDNRSREWCTHARTHAHTYIHTYIHTHARTHARTHALSLSLSLARSLALALSLNELCSEQKSIWTSCLYIVPPDLATRIIFVFCFRPCIVI